MSVGYFTLFTAALALPTLYRLGGEPTGMGQGIPLATVGEILLEIDLW
ncbi:MAG: hypothetical protein Q6L68_07290 [Thermostichus sp. DG02_5_bins_236]